MHKYIKFEIIYPNGETKEVEALNAKELIRAYDLATKENINTRIIQKS